MKSNKLSFADFKISCLRVAEINKTAAGEFNVYPIWFKREFVEMYLSAAGTDKMRELVALVLPILPTLIQYGSFGTQVSFGARKWVKQYKEGLLCEENSFSVSPRIASIKTKPKTDPITRLIDLKAARESMEAEIIDLQAKIEGIKAQQVEIMKEFIG